MNFWRNPEDNENIEIRFTSCDDYSLGYVDFLDTRLSKDSFDRTPLPTTIFLSGNGSFSQPFQVYRHDPLVSAMQYHCEDKMVRFENHNSIFRCGKCLSTISTVRFSRFAFRISGYLPDGVSTGSLISSMGTA